MREKLLELIENDGDFESFLDEVNTEEQQLREWHSQIQQMHDSIVATIFHNKGDDLMSCLINYLELVDPQLKPKNNIFGLLSQTLQKFNEIQHLQLKGQTLECIEWLTAEQIRIEREMNAPEIEPEVEIEEPISDPMIIKINENLVQLKTILVHNNSLMKDDFDRFHKTIKKSNLSSILGGKKNQELVPISPELQKSQHMCFRTMQKCYQQINELVIQSIDVNDNQQYTNLLLDHLVLINFMMKDLQQNVENSFYFLNFYLSMAKQLEDATQSMIDELSFSSNSSSNAKGVINFQLNLKKDISMMQREIKRRFNQD